MHQSSLYSKQQRKTDVPTWRNQKRIQRQSIDGDEKSARLFHAVLPTLSDKKYRAANGRYAPFIDMKKRLLSVYREKSYRGSDRRMPIQEHGD